MRRCPTRALVITLVAWLVATPAPLFAQNGGNGGEPIVIGYRVTLHSQILNEDRPLWVYTPPGYDQSTDAYPVLYLLDGRGHFHHTTGAMQFLAANNRMPEMIVVAIPNTDRTRDLTPPASVADASQFPAAGGADNFLRFIREELQPWVEREFRTQPYRVLVGHSFGGLFAMHTLITHPETFNAYISISPSLWWNAEATVRNGESLFTDHPDLKGSLYMTMGNEGGRMLAGAWGFARILETSAPESFDWEWTPMEAEDHGSVPHRSTYDGLEWLFRAWNAPGLMPRAVAAGADGLTIIEAHYAGLSERVGYSVPVPEGIINQMGYALLGQQKVDDAIMIFRANVDRHPGSANVYDSLGDALAAACRRDEARDSYGRAYEMAAANSHPNTAVYKANFDRVSEEIVGGVACTP